MIPLHVQLNLLDPTTVKVCRAFRRLLWTL